MTIINHRAQISFPGGGTTRGVGIGLTISYHGVRREEYRSVRIDKTVDFQRRYVRVVVIDPPVSISLSCASIRMGRGCRWTIGDSSCSVLGVLEGVSSEVAGKVPQILG